MKIYKLLLIIIIIGALPTSAYSGSDFTITLKVTGGGTYDYCIAGTQDGATDGHDNAWDIPAPPSSPNNMYISSYFPHPEWGHVFDRFRQDIKATDLPKEWIFEVSSNISGKLTIQWPDLKNKIPGKNAVLVDIDGDGKEINMQNSSSFVYTNNGEPRRFLVMISQKISTPQPPEGLKARLIKLKIKPGPKRAVLLEWMNNLEPDIAGYNVYRSTTSGSGYQRINYSLISEPEYTDEQVAKGETYYVVTAVNTSSGESGYSNEVEVYVPPDVKPPQSLKGKSSKSGVKLSWKRNRERDLAGYNVYRSTTPGSGYQKINNSLLRWHRYTDKNVTSGETYYYVVTAVNTAGGESGYSNEVEVTIIKRWKFK